MAIKGIKKLTYIRSVANIATRLTCDFVLFIFPCMCYWFLFCLSVCVVVVFFFFFYFLFSFLQWGQSHWDLLPPPLVHIFFFFLKAQSIMLSSETVFSSAFYKDWIQASVFVIFKFGAIKFTQCQLSYSKHNFPIYLPLSHHDLSMKKNKTKQFSSSISLLMYFSADHNTIFHL